MAGSRLERTRSASFLASMGSVLQRALQMSLTLTGIGDLDGVALGHEAIVKPGPVQRGFDGHGDGPIELGQDGEEAVGGESSVLDDNVA